MLSTNVPSNSLQTRYPLYEQKTSKLKTLEPVMTKCTAHDQKKCQIFLSLRDSQKFAKVGNVCSHIRKNGKKNVRRRGGASQFFLVSSAPQYLEQPSVWLRMAVPIVNLAEDGWRTIETLSIIRSFLQYREASDDKEMVFCLEMDRDVWDKIHNAAKWPPNSKRYDKRYSFNRMRLIVDRIRKVQKKSTKNFLQPL